MENSYLFEMDNLKFRRITKDDLDYLLMLDTDPEVMRFFPKGAQTTQQIEEKIPRYIKEYDEKGYGALLVFEIDSGEFIGRAGFADTETNEVEVGYLVLKKYWGKGYATRILKALLLWAKENIHRDKIIAFTPIQHVVSERVMQKAGMIFSKKGKMKDVDCVIYEYKI